jgi:predicted RNase H-like nuclease
VIAGADGCVGGWVAVRLRDGRWDGFEVVPTFADLLAQLRSAAAIGVDIPIGLPLAYPRPADVAARRFVGPRRGSVFPTPLREALEAATHAEVSALHAAATGKGIPRQSFELRHKILEVEAVAESDERVPEVHPEVSFRELAGEPVPLPKRSAPGRALRRALLESVGIELPDGIPRAVEGDVVDAAAVAWTADRYARGAAKPLPEDHAARIGAIWR